jgi:hypothetical protein
MGSLVGDAGVGSDDTVIGAAAFDVRTSCGDIMTAEVVERLVGVFISFWRRREAKTPRVRSSSFCTKMTWFVVMQCSFSWTPLS